MTCGFSLYRTGANEASCIYSPEVRTVAYGKNSSAISDEIKMNWPRPATNDQVCLWFCQSEIWTVSNCAQNHACSYKFDYGRGMDA